MLNGLRRFVVTRFLSLSTVCLTESRRTPPRNLSSILRFKISARASMYRIIAPVAALMMLVASPHALAQTLTDVDVQAAIKAGEARKYDQLLSDCVADVGFGE